MSTLQEIQKLVREAEWKIQADDHQAVQNVWRDIKSKIGQCTDLEWKYRADMKLLIFKHLIAQLQQGTKPTQINLAKLKDDLETGKVKASEPEKISSWLAW